MRRFQINLGLSFLTLSLLMLELTLTRVFSTTLWYHFAFMAVSLALFGLSAGGIFLFLLKDKFPEKKISNRLGLISLLYPISIVFCAFILFNIRTSPSLNPAGMVKLSFVYFICAIPFFCGGLAVSLILSRFAEQISTLYFFDLCGAGLGCLLTIPGLNLFGGDGILFLIAGIATISSFLFHLQSNIKTKLSILILLAIFILILAFHKDIPFLKIRYIKGFVEKEVFKSEPIFIGWNSFSRVGVYHWSDLDEQPKIRFKEREDDGLKFYGVPKEKYVSWGISDVYPGPFPRQRSLSIDGAAGTVIMEWHGNLENLKYLHYEITSLAYNLKEKPKVLIIGPGGGIDILTAISFGSDDILAVELNPLVVRAVNEIVGDFSGRPYSYPGVRTVVDEGRSFLRRSEEKFDIIQATLVDTWAATAAGAYALSENALYTVEAFIDYLNHLHDDGILTMSRFIFDPPRQTLRLVSLAREAMSRLAIYDYKDHFLIIKKDKISNFMLKKSGFTPDEITKMETLARDLKFEIVYSPFTPANRYFADLILAKDPTPIYESYLFDISPSTDDRPFFFNQVRLKNFLLPAKMREAKTHNESLDAVLILGTLLILSFVLCLLFIICPLLLVKREEFSGVPYKFNFIIYFSALGLGFIILEISLMQKFILFLGHPIYSLAVILFSLLIFSGIGSYLTNFIRKIAFPLAISLAIAGIIIITMLYSLVFPVLFENFIGLQTFKKIMMSIALLAPLGLLMGMPFPLGLKLVSQLKQDFIPWVWAINGATSVCGSIVAFAFAMNYGFDATINLGHVIYLFGIASVWRMRK